MGVALIYFLAHEALCEANVLHRDISWGNVMCKPVHHDTSTMKPPPPPINADKSSIPAVSVPNPEDSRASEDVTGYNYIDSILYVVLLFNQL